MRTLTTLSLLISTISLSACGGDPLLIEGSVAGEGMSEALTAFWGGRYIIFADAELECIDLAWVHHSYSDALAYEDDDGAAGDGNSLTRDCPTRDGWAAAAATPGAV
jgi:hypothetical protein